LRNVDTVFGKGKAEWKVEVLGKNGAFVSLAVVIGVFEDQDLVIGPDAREGVWVGGHGGDPESAGGVEVDGDRVAEFGEVLFGGEEVDLKAIGDFELGAFLCGCEGG